MAPSTSEPSSKRIKISVQDKFRPDLFDSTFRNTLRQSIQTSKPYPHCKISDLIQPNLLHRVQKEIYEHLCFTTKETDIYKVNQTGDLANLDGLSPEEQKRLPSLCELRHALSSCEFREFVQDVTGCGLLSPTRMDMSVNTYTAGSHLLNHDDVIGTRRISFILYMPDMPWSVSDGGALELYPVIKQDTPANEPSVSVPPVWNQFCMFTVLPGYSFHAVQEVVSDKRRLSIQGWFHYLEETAPQGTPSLEQIQNSSKQDPFEMYPTERDRQALTEKDKEALAEFINPVYLDTDQLVKLCDRFLEDSTVRLAGFLKDDVWQEIEMVTLDADREDGFLSGVLTPHGSGLRGDWYVQGPPVSQRFLRLSRTINTTEKTSLAFDRLAALFKTGPFRRWLGCICELKLNGYRGMARRFRPGHDFTLATADRCDMLDLTLCLTQSKANEWHSGDYGGYECYMAESEQDDDPATYKQSDDGALLTLPAHSNELCIVLREPEVLRFVKYVSASAPGSRWDVAFEYSLDT